MENLIACFLEETEHSVNRAVFGRRAVMASEKAKEIDFGKTDTAAGLAQKALGIGDRLKEGTLTTVVFGFDGNKDPIRVPEGVFIGEAIFCDQDKVVAKANVGLDLKGTKALTRLSDDECAQLTKVWAKVAPPELQTSTAPEFWGASDYCYSGRLYHGGEPYWSYLDQNYSRPVPAAIRGPARS